MVIPLFVHVACPKHFRGKRLVSDFRMAVGGFRLLLSGVEIEVLRLAHVSGESSVRVSPARLCRSGTTPTHRPAAKVKWT